jgi:hypothetical protein
MDSVDDIDFDRDLEEYRAIKGVGGASVRNIPHCTTSGYSAALMTGKPTDRYSL